MIIAWVRRHASLVAVLAVLLGIIILTMGSSLVGARSFLGADNLESFAPWRTAPPDGVVPTNPLVGDTIDVAMPSKATFVRSLHNGEIAMWQPLILGGRPLAAVPNTSLFSALNLPYWILPLWYAPGFVKLIELAIAVGFTCLFLRRVGLSTTAGLIGGAVFAFSGFQVVWTNWPQAHVGALIAVLFWAVEKAISDRRIASTIPLALTVATMWFEGFPSVTGYALAFAGVYVVVRVLGLQRIRESVVSLSVAGLGVALGTALAAVQLLPFIESLSRLDLSVREQSSAATLPLRVVATFAVPNAFGSPVDRNYFGPANYIEIQSFIGIAALGLVCVGVVYGTKVVSRGVHGYFVAALIVALWVSFVGGLALELLQQMPLFGLNYIGRLRSVTGFLIAVLAALGVEAIRQGVPGRSSGRRRALLVVVGLGTGAAVTFALFRAWQMAKANLEISYFWSRSLVAVAVAVVVVVLLVLSHVRRRWAADVVIAGAVVIVGIEAAMFAMPFWPQIPRDQFYPETQAHEFLRAGLGGDRLVSAGLAMYPGTTSFYGLRSVTGHAFHDPPWRDLLEAVDENVMDASPTFSILASDAALGTSPVLDRFAARFLVVDPRVRIVGERFPAVSPVRTHGDHGFQMDIPTHGRIRGVTLFIDNGVDPGSQPDIITAEVVAGNGDIIAAGSRRIAQYLRPGQLDIAVVETSRSDGVRVRIRYEGDTGLAFRRDPHGAAAVEVVKPEEDGLVVAYSDEVVVYERTTSLNRIRWAPSAIADEDPASRVERLRSGAPGDLVILSQPGPPGSGSSASISSIEDLGDSIRVTIAADGAGYLVVADTLQDDWHAEIDTEPVPVVAADHAFGAVFVPAGEHVVTLDYRPGGQASGALISGVAVLACALVALWGIVSRRSNRREESDVVGLK